MKLYYSEGACSLAPHILLEEAGTAYTAQKMVGDNGDFEKAEFLKLNPFGYVPLLELPTGEVIAEGVAIQNYIADMNPTANLAPRHGTFERVKMNQWMTFISSELHKGFSPIFGPKAYAPSDAGAAEVSETARENLGKKLDIVDGMLKDKKYVMGNDFSIADAYLFTVFNWTNYVGIKTDKWPHLVAHSKTMMARPAVHRAMKSEGLLD